MTERTEGWGVDMRRFYEEIAKPEAWHSQHYYRDGLSLCGRFYFVGRLRARSNPKRMFPKLCPDCLLELETERPAEIQQREFRLQTVKLVEGYMLAQDRSVLNWSKKARQAWERLSSGRKTTLNDVALVMAEAGLVPRIKGVDDDR